MNELFEHPSPVSYVAAQICRTRFPDILGKNTPYQQGLLHDSSIEEIICIDSYFRDRRNVDAYCFTLSSYFGSLTLFLADPQCGSRRALEKGINLCKIHEKYFEQQVHIA